MRNFFIFLSGCLAGAFALYYYSVHQLKNFKNDASTNKDIVPSNTIDNGLPNDEKS